MQLALFVRCLAVVVELVYTLITAITQQFQTARQRQTTRFEQRKIVRFASTGGHAENGLRALRRAVNHDLSLLSVALLLTRVVLTLFF